MWIMVVDRPYNPSIRKYETFEAARDAAEAWLAENMPIYPPRLYKATVYVAEVSFKVIARCDY